MEYPLISFDQAKVYGRVFLSSPSLFILMAESFIRKLEYERIMGCLPGIHFARGIKEINHSQFIDDTPLLVATSSIIARNFKKILDAFL
jgi:hypothetical protein